MSVTSVNPAANASNEYYLTRQSQMESNVRSYPRKLPLAIAKAQAAGLQMLKVLNTSIV
jgi:diaminobutyrate-2-oxoglutarate transaminase